MVLNTFHSSVSILFNLYQIKFRAMESNKIVMLSLSVILICNILEHLLESFGIFVSCRKFTRVNSVIGSTRMPKTLFKVQNILFLLELVL